MERPWRLGSLSSAAKDNKHLQSSASSPIFRCETGAVLNHTKLWIKQCKQPGLWAPGCGPPNIPSLCPGGVQRCPCQCLVDTQTKQWGLFVFQQHLWSCSSHHCSSVAGLNRVYHKTQPVYTPFFITTMMHHQCILCRFISKYVCTGLYGTPLPSLVEQQEASWFPTGNV